MYLQMVIKSPSCLASLSSACDSTEIFILPSSWIALLIPSLQMVWEPAAWCSRPALTWVLEVRYLCSCSSCFNFWPFCCIASSYEVLPQTRVSVAIFHISPHCISLILSLHVGVWSEMRLILSFLAILLYSPSLFILYFLQKSTKKSMLKEY